jgi:hypothetical protein
VRPKQNVLPRLAGAEDRWPDVESLLLIALERPQTIGLRKHEDYRLTLCLLVADVILVANSAFAEAPSAPPTPTAPPAPAQSLSEKLNRSNGVIRPKEVDPAIEKPAPDARDPNVAPAPGTSGGATAPQPK